MTCDFRTFAWYASQSGTTVPQSLTVRERRVTRMGEVGAFLVSLAFTLSSRIVGRTIAWRGAFRLTCRHSGFLLRVIAVTFSDSIDRPGQRITYAHYFEAAARRRAPDGRGVRAAASK